MLMGMYNIIMYIHAWASALLVLTIRAMPEPRRVGRVTGKIPTLFVYKQLTLLWNSPCWES